ncbi:MAG: gamma-glutamyl-gamma-aminobutyrate hydrolase family protein [Lachnospiraceae bacterium]|nr:gamma-glutamyl-gamma-aminobutyrate hydrolase family protein [Lachnospiraceae bacterium]
MRPVIGLIPLYDDEKESYWMLPGYMKGLEKCGALPIMLPLTSDKEELMQAFDLCDGLLLTGGHDIDPKVYGREASEKCGIPCKMRDVMESILLKAALDADKPVFGICRGIQFLNAYLGGDLYQDLPTEYACGVEHHMTPPYSAAAHKVKVLEGSMLAGIIGSGVHEVNSYHHQAVKTPAGSLEVMAVSEDGIIEAVSVKNKKFAVGVQWHPEFSYEENTDSIKLMRAFVDACK